MLDAPFYLTTSLLGMYFKEITRRGWSAEGWHPTQTQLQGQSPLPTLLHVGSKRLTADPFPGTHLLTVCHGPPPRAALSLGLGGGGGDQLSDANCVQRPCRVRLKPTPLRLPLCSAPSPAPASLPHPCPPQIPWLKEPHAPESHLRLCFWGT